MINEYSDQEVLEGILSGSEAQDQVLNFLYSSNRERIFHYVLKNNGNEAEARDIFQDGIIALTENIRSGKFRGDSAISSYLYSICRFLWLNQLKRKGIKAKIMANHPPQIVEESHLPKFLEKEKRNQVLEIFKLLGEQCKVCLIYSVYYEYPLEDIQKMLGYKNVQIVRNKKYKCLTRLKSLLAERPDLVNILKNL